MTSVFCVVIFILLGVNGLYNFLLRNQRKREHRLHKYNIPRQFELKSQFMSTLADIDGQKLTGSQRYPNGYAYEKTNGLRSWLAPADFDDLVRKQLEVEGFEFCSNM